MTPSEVRFRERLASASYHYASDFGSWEPGRACVREAVGIAASAGWSEARVRELCRGNLVDVDVVLGMIRERVAS